MEPPSPNYLHAIQAVLATLLLNGGSKKLMSFVAYFVAVKVVLERRPGCFLLEWWIQEVDVFLWYCLISPLFQTVLSFIDFIR